MGDKKSFLLKILMFLLDVVCFFIAIVVSLALAAGDGFVRLLSESRLIVILYPSFTGLFLLLMNSYAELPGDYSFYSALKIISAIIISHVFFALLMIFLGRPVSYIFLINIAVYSMALCGLYRFAAVSVYYMRRHMLKDRASNEKRVIIFGAGDAGKYLANMLFQDSSKKMRPVAFIDDNPALEGKKIKGLPVVGPRLALPYAAKKYGAETIIIAIPFVDNSTIREIFNLCCQAGCTVKRFGNMSNLAFESLAKSTITEVRVEDLLQRDVVRLDLESLSVFLRNKTVLVTGGAGSIGSELCKQILNYGAKQLIMLDINENGLFEAAMELRRKYRESSFVTCIGSVRDRDLLSAVFAQYKPQIVFHAAAYKHVPMMELNFREALVNNIIGTKNAADIAASSGAEKFIMISTDKAVNPSNIMGATKRIAELIIQEKNAPGGTVFAAVRFGNVLGSNGSVVPIFQRQLREGGPLTVTHKDIRRYFMTIPEAVQLVLQAGSISKGGEVFVLDMGEPVKIYDLAVTMIKLSGLEPEKDIKIEIVGLRPGEKLYEELSLSEETVDKTALDKIFVLKRDAEPAGNIKPDLDRLCDEINAKDFSKAYERMKALIPSLKNISYAE